MAPKPATQSKVVKKEQPKINDTKSALEDTGMKSALADENQTQNWIMDNNQSQNANVSRNF